MKSSPPSDDNSDVFQFQTEGQFDYTKIHSHPTKASVNADVCRFNDDVIITFSNTRNETSSTPTCVTSTPLHLSYNGSVTSFLAVTGCSVLKVIARQISSDEIMVVSLNSGLYGGTEAVVYKAKTNGTYSVVQRIPIHYTSDVMFLKSINSLFLVMPNQHRKNDYAIVIEYDVPTQIYKYANFISHQLLLKLSLTIYFVIFVTVVITMEASRLYSIKSN